MAIFCTYSAVGDREDLLDAISNITPSETPYLNRFKKVQVDGIKVEWQTDSLRAAAANAQVQGYSYSAVIGTVSPTTRVYNYTQILSVGYEVSKTQEAVSKAGRASEVAYQKAKAVKEFALDFELALAQANERVAPAAGVAGEFRSVPTWISTNVALGAGADLTETMLNNLLQTAWTSGAIEMNAIYGGAYQKRRISGFPSSVRQMMQEDTVYKNLVTVYESDFGTYEVVLDRRLTTTELHVLNDDMWQIGILRPIKSDVALTNQRSAEAFVIEGEVTLIANNEAASAKYTGLKDA
jgi:hypothetical protein